MRRADPRWYFLVLGLALAFGFIQAVALWSSVPAALSWGAIAVTLTISMAVGLFFGVYPATRAARLDPIVALRAETT